MSLSLPRVTQAWGSSLADLEPVPAEKLEVLLKVCLGGNSDAFRAGDAGEVLLRALPLSGFLAKAGGQYTDEVIPGLIRLLEELPCAWQTRQMGPDQAQADFTQLMLDLRKIVWMPNMPHQAQQQLSRAVLRLLQQLFIVASEQATESSISWAQTGCYLMLRALTRSHEFISDPVLPLLPSDAFSILQWLSEQFTGTVHSRSIPSRDGDIANGSAAAAGSSSAQAQEQYTFSQQWRDDKFYLLITKLVLTATKQRASEAAAYAAAAIAQVRAADSKTVSVSVDPSCNGIGSTTTCNGATGKDGSPLSAAADIHTGIGPQLLCDLLHWSSAKVKSALQQLLGHGSVEHVAPSREAATAAAQLAAVCIHTLQKGPRLQAELEHKLRQQIEDLLDVALAVGEAVVHTVHHDEDSDKFLALGGRVLAATIPFIAAAASRSDLEQQLALSSRLQQLMLAAASAAGRLWLAARNPRTSSASGTLTTITESRELQHVQEHPLHNRHHSSHRLQPNVGSRIRAGMSKLASRRAKRKQGLGGFGILGHEPPPQFYRRTTSPVNTVPSVPVRAGGPDSTSAAVQQASAGITSVLTGLHSQVDQQEIVLPPEELAHPWSWDITQELTVLSNGLKLSDLSLSCGIGGFMLARAAAEALCEALTAAWLAGSEAPARCLFLVPRYDAAKQVVTILALGRLYVMLSADPGLGRLLVPLLADVLHSSDQDVSSNPTFGQAIRESITGATAGTSGPWRPLTNAGKLSSSGEQAMTAEVAGAVVTALEGMASACAERSDDTWVYDQALQLLLTMYREPTVLSLQLLAGRSAHHTTAGLLADALHLLAEELEDAPQEARHDLRTKLLLLSTDVASRVGSKSGLVTADLGDLLVAVAVAAEGLQPRTLKLLGKTSNSSRMSMHDIQAAQREDASTTRLYRSLWLYTAAFKLVNPSSFAVYGAPVGGTVDEWQTAAGRLAAVTPLLVVGTDSYHEADLVERLKVEMDEQLVQIGSLGSQASLFAVLVSMLGGRNALEHLNLPQPTEAVLLAFVVAVAAAELSRVALAPLPDLEDDPAVACPLGITLGYLKGVLPDGVAAAWVGAIVRRAGRLYINRLLALAAMQEQQRGCEGTAGPFAGRKPTAPALAYAEQLACVLIANLAGGLGTVSATVSSTAPVVVALADELLTMLLKVFPALLHSQLCYCALLVQLQKEEGDIPMGQVKAPVSGLVWDRTKSWVQAAAEVAPLTTEALLHSFLTSSESLPGATPPAWLADSNQQSFMTAPAGSVIGAASVSAVATVGDTLSAGSPTPTVGRFARVATQAAFRRAADLLQACSAARRRQHLGSQSGDGPYEGAMALMRKLHYTGYVQGVMTGQSCAAAVLLQKGQLSKASMGSAVSSAAIGNTSNELHSRNAVDERSDASVSDLESELSEQTQTAVAEEIASQLEVALNQSSPRGAQLANALQCATALLAVQPDSFSYSQLGMRVIAALARAPLKHLTPDTMRLSRFSWCWVSVESPEVLVPLISSLGSAWIWTVDQRLGLFSGTRHASRTGVESELADSKQDDAVPVHNEPTLQGIASHFIWLSYLLETWAVVSKLRDSRTAAATAVYGRLLAASLQDPAVLSHHPAAIGAYFRLLTLGLVYGRTCLTAAGSVGSGSTVGTDVLLLFDHILRTALFWFKSPPRYFARCTRQDAAKQLLALEAFLAELNTVIAFWSELTHSKAYPSFAAVSLATGRLVATSSRGYSPPEAPHPVWGTASPDVAGCVELLQFLCAEELARLRVWTEPLKYADSYRVTPAVPWRKYASTAWAVDPALALSMSEHFPAVAELRTTLENLAVKHAAEAQVQLLPSAALLLATAKSQHKSEALRYLAVWAPGSAAQGLQLLSGQEGRHPAVRSYAVKCLFNEQPEKLVFFLPQLVQLLRGDTDGAITNFFLTAASHSDLFAHQLIWALNSEAKPPEEAFNPEVKRSGWQPPKDTGLWEYSARVKQQIELGMTPAQQEYWQAEGGYFQQVTELSGYLYKFGKDERRVKLQEALAQFQPPRTDLYIPTNPEAKVKRHIPSSGACMQSAAKVPILVAFDVEVPAPGATAGHNQLTVPAKMACIFKVGDDIRQDVLAIQVIKLLHHAFEAAGLNLYLRPYGCLPTGYECGIIEVVPNTRSRAALGELSDRGLHDIFTAEFGAPGSSAFERARENFIVSEAAYAVASYLLQAKDRHNGNIMLDDQGHIVHIDFGFILEISPGGNLGFESAAFKLSHEMTQVLDPGGSRKSPQLALFEELVVRAYLAARTVAEPIIATVSLMAESGLPCFSRGAPVANLRRRFHLEMNDAQAAAFMRSQIADAYDKWTTGFYDYIQSLQNKIPY